MDLIIDFDWPGNVRQLANKIEALITNSESDIIWSDDVVRELDLEDVHVSKSRGLTAQVADKERSLIIQALLKKHHITEAARYLEIDRATLHKKIKRHSIDTEAIKRARSPE